MKVTVEVWHDQGISIQFTDFGSENFATLCHDDVIKWKYFPHYWPFCAGNSPVTGEFPAERPVMRSFDVSFDLRLNQQMSKQWRHRWFETPSRLLWRNCNCREFSHRTALLQVEEMSSSKTQFLSISTTKYRILSKIERNLIPGNINCDVIWVILIAKILSWIFLNRLSVSYDRSVAQIL